MRPSRQKKAPIRVWCSSRTSAAELSDSFVRAMRRPLGAAPQARKAVAKTVKKAAKAEKKPKQAAQRGAAKGKKK